jgi:hypothetical protein
MATSIGISTSPASPHALHGDATTDVEPNANSADKMAASDDVEETDGDLDVGRRSLSTPTSGASSYERSHLGWFRERHDDDDQHDDGRQGDRQCFEPAGTGATDTTSAAEQAADRKWLASSYARSQYHSIQQLSRPSTNSDLGGGNYGTSLDCRPPSTFLQNGERRGQSASTDGIKSTDGRRRAYCYDGQQMDVDNNNEGDDDAVDDDDCSGDAVFYCRRSLTDRRATYSVDSNDDDGDDTSQSLSPSRQTVEKLNGITNEDNCVAAVSPQQPLRHRKRMPSPTPADANDHGEPTMTSPSSSARRGSLMTSWSGMPPQGGCDYSGAEAKRARVENIINSMQACSTPSPLDATAVDIHATASAATPAGLRASGSRAMDDAAERSSDVASVAFRALSDVGANGGRPASETGDAIGQRRSNRRKQYVPQHQHANGGYDEGMDDFRSRDERPFVDGEETDDSCPDRMHGTSKEPVCLDDQEYYDSDDRMSEEEIRRIRTEAVREGVKRVEQSLADMRQKFLCLAADDEVVVDVESDDFTMTAAESGCGVASDVNRNEIHRSSVRNWFRSAAEMAKEVGSATKKPEAPGFGTSTLKSPCNDGQLEKLTAVLKAEISDSVGSLVDDIVGTFVERFFSRHRPDRKLADGQRREEKYSVSNSGFNVRGDRPPEKERNRRRSSSRSPDTLSDDVTPGYVDGPAADDDDRFAKIMDAEPELKSAHHIAAGLASLPPLPASGVGVLPFPFTVPVGDDESVRQSAARLAAYRQALAAAYLDSAFMQPNKTAFEVPRSAGHHQQVALPPTAVTALPHRLFAPHPYYPANGTRFPNQQSSLPFAKVFTSYSLGRLYAIAAIPSVYST